MSCPPAELEKRWNEALQRQAELSSRLEATPPNTLQLGADEKERLLELGKDLASVWNHPKASVALKKRILRTVLEEIIVDLKENPPEILLTIHWSGGVHTEIRVPKNRTGHHRRATDREVVELIRELSQVCEDKIIAAILNRLGYRTGTKKTWNQSRVRSARSTHRIAVFDPSSKREWLNLQETATALGVSKTIVRRLIEEQILPARQVVRHAPWVIGREALERPEVKQAVEAARQGDRIPRTVLDELEIPLFSVK